MSFFEWFAVSHAAFVVGLSAVAVVKYALGPRRWHIVGMGVSYIVLTIANVQSMAFAPLGPGALKFHASVAAWVIGDFSLLLLLGKARLGGMAKGGGRRV